MNKTVLYSLAGLALYFVVLKPVALNFGHAVNAANQCEVAGTGAVVELKPGVWMTCN